MNNDIKLKITAIVTRWEVDHPVEFDLFLTARKKKTENLKDKFAETGTFIERLLYEIPESLDFQLTSGLTEEEKTWLATRIGGQWFAKEFKQYNVSQKT